MNGPELAFRLEFAGMPIQVGSFWEFGDVGYHTFKALRKLLPVVEPAYIEKALAGRRGIQRNEEWMIDVFSYRFARTKGFNLLPSDGRSFDLHRIFSLTTEDWRTCLVIDDGLDLTTPLGEMWLLYVVNHESFHALLYMYDESEIQKLAADVIVTFCEENRIYVPAITEIAKVFWPVGFRS